MSARVRLISGPREWNLGSEAVTVPAGVTVVSISGFDSRTVPVDGRRVRLSSGSEGVVVLDLSRSTGYHRIVVDGATYWFGTDDAKLGLAGIEAMLRQLGTLGTGWTGQVLFSDGTGLRDPHVVHGWLEDWADVALSANRRDPDDAQRPNAE